MIKVLLLLFLFVFFYLFIFIIYNTIVCCFHCLFEKKKVFIWKGIYFIYLLLYFIVYIFFIGYVRSFWGNIIPGFFFWKINMLSICGFEQRIKRSKLTSLLIESFCSEFTHVFLVVNRVKKLLLLNHQRGIPKPWYHKERNFIDNLINIEKHAFIIVDSRVILIKKSL
jgi:hypothetical protein